jgi:hypothetical protein
MKRYLMFPAIICFVAAVLLADTGHAQSSGPIKVWGANYFNQANVPAPNAGFIAVGSGDNHCLGLKADGTIVAWGDNSSGQCAVPLPNANFVAMDGGTRHSLGLKSDGTIAAWGSNDDGQCNIPSPNSGFVAVAAGCDFSMGLKSDGTIVAWGSNDSWQCTIPSPNADFVAIAAGSDFSVGLKSDGTIVAWGNNNDNQCDIPLPNADFVAIAAGYYHSLGLKSNGTIVAWGDNSSGQCAVPLPNANFVAMDGGYLHSLGLKSDGTIAAWGNNGNGQCTMPSPNAGFVGVAAGVIHSMGLRGPDCHVSPASIDFGTAFVDGHKDAVFAIRNVGFGTLAGSVSEICDQFSVVSGGGAYSIDAGDSLVVTVRFSPTVEGPDTCDVETGTECSSVTCLGTGQGPLCSISPPALDFGFVTIGRHADLTVAVTNTGGGRLTGSVAETCPYFSIVSGGGAYDLGRGDSVYVTVRFAPLTTNAVACTISTGGSCGDVICAGTGDRAPDIFAVRDVPGDQGGFLNLAWDASPGDNPQEQAITRYTVWRAIDPTAAELASLAPGSFISCISDLAPTAKKDVVRLELAGSLKYYWRLISSLDAYYLEGYSEAVPTLFDSTAVCSEYHYVQVIAHTSSPGIFWVSAPDSGRSVDNLAPAPPVGLAGEQHYAPAGLSLSWDPNNEADLAGYAIYRGTDAGFEPGPGNIIASIPDTLYLDGEWHWGGGYYYKVAAVDNHGNESGYALLAPDEVTGDETPGPPAASYLAQNFPNPFNPVTRIEFGLAAPAVVRLHIYDAAGRLVRSLAEGTLPAGHYVKIWDGRDVRGSAVASGIYFYCLDAGSFAQTKKMVLLK